MFAKFTCNQKTWIFQNVSLLIGKKLGDTININFATGHAPTRQLVLPVVDAWMLIENMIIAFLMLGKLKCIVSRRL